MTKRHREKAGLIWVWVAALSACATNALPPPAAGTGALATAASSSASSSASASASAGRTASTVPAAVLMQQVVQLIGEAACDTTEQCHSIGVGDKACGGPEAYLAWSSGVTQQAALAAAASQHRVARKLDNERSGIVSNCAVTPDPGAVCRPRATDGKRSCQLGQGGGRSAV